MAVVLLGSSVIVRPGMAQTCPANIPYIHGVWRTLPYLMPINPISATLLNTGEVLIVAGSENDAYNHASGGESNRMAIWDPPTETTPGSITVQNADFDVFCSGTAVLPDGRALVVGGTADYSYTGANRAAIFDPKTGRVVQSQRMVDGRWYATATTLGDGGIMAFSGLSLRGDTNDTVEMYDLRHAGAGWASPVTRPRAYGAGDRGQSAYPYAHGLKAGASDAGRVAGPPAAYYSELTSCSRNTNHHAALPAFAIFTFTVCSTWFVMTRNRSACCS